MGVLPRFDATSRSANGGGGPEPRAASSGSANTSGTKSTVAPLPKAQSKIKPPVDVSCSRPAGGTVTGHQVDRHRTHEEERSRECP
jgi:hypothetical protein